MSGSVCLPIVRRRSPAGVCAHIPSKGTGICGQLDLEIADTRYWIAGRRMWNVVRVVVDPRRGATSTEPFGETGRSMADACHDDVGAMPVLGGCHSRCTSWQRTDRDAMTKRVPEWTTDRRARGTGTGSACSVSSTRVIGPMTRWARGVMSTGWRCRAAPGTGGSIWIFEYGDRRGLLRHAKAPRHERCLRGRVPYTHRLDTEPRGCAISERSTCPSPNRCGVQ